MNVRHRFPTARLGFVPATLALCAALLTVLAALWLRGNAWQPPAAQPPRLDELAAAAPQKADESGAIPAVLLERPPFHVSRRPPPAVQEPSAAPAAVALDKARFYGIVSSPAMKVLMAEIEGQPQVLRVGDRIGQWQLQSIHNRQITFIQGQERHVVELPHAYMNAGPNNHGQPSP